MKDSPRPLASAEMALIRLAYASDLPTPEDALRKLAEAERPAPAARRRCRPAGGGRARAGAAASPRRAERPVAARRARLRGAAARPLGPARAVRGRRGARPLQARHQLVQALEREVRLDRFEEGSIAFSLVEGVPRAGADTVADACRNGPANAGWLP